MGVMRRACRVMYLWMRDECMGREAAVVASR